MSKIPRSRISTVIAKRSLEGIPARRLAEEIAAYLLENHRTGELESLRRDILQYRSDHGIVEVYAASSHPLDNEALNMVKAQLRALYPSAKQFIVSEKLDSRLVGGIRLELANQQFDASIRTKLNHFKQLTLAGRDI